MNELNGLFRQRIGMPENEKVTFETLDNLLEKTAITLPFENLGIISHTTRTVTREHLINKILVNNEGGLCYELNPLLYFFLLENGFHVEFVRGKVYDYETKDWSKVGRTHIAILLQHEGQTYLIDTGFGGNLPLKPVPLNGETVSSKNGEFRVNVLESNDGNSILEMKLKYKDTEWKLGYAFDANQSFEHLAEINEVQELIVKHPNSRFNKTPLMTQLKSDGNVTLTENSFTQWIHGTSTKEAIDNLKFIELAKQHFGFQEGNLATIFKNI